MDIHSGDAVLSVSSSGVKLFELLAQDKKIPKVIIAFDYSPKQVAYNYLLKSAIATLSYKEFTRYFRLRVGDADQSENRKNLISKIPPQVKKYLPRRHHFTKRDMLLNECNEISWFKNEKKYYILRKRVGRIKFCEYEVSHHNATLSRIFRPHSFNVVYLSNILDWLCWHNRDIQNIFPLESIYNDIRKILKKGGKIVLCNLKNRESFVPDFLNKLHIKQDITHQTYKYLWRNVTILCQ